MSSIPPFYMVFDVESVGLYGEGFAVGYVVLDRTGREVEGARFACDPARVRAVSSTEMADWKWVIENVPFHRGVFAHDRFALTHLDPRQVRREFWSRWDHWRERRAVLMADCAWPVEARFLCACVDDLPEDRATQGPYPLHDLASVLMACGKDPLADYGRRANEMPRHDPLADARQSARVLAETLRLRYQA